MRIAASPRHLRRLLAAAGLALAACSHPDEPPATRAGAPSPAEAVMASHHAVWAPDARTVALAKGGEALVRLDCVRCHAIDGLAPDARRFEAFPAAPDLTRVGARIRLAWIDEYLRDPYDLRPMMDETMVRVRLTPDDRRAVVRSFAAVAEVADPYDGAPAAEPAPTPPSAARIEAGRRLFVARGCATCHTVGNVPTGRTARELEAAGLPARLAPNLRFTRERLSPDTLVAWIVDPQAFVPGTFMPDLQVSRADAEAIRDFLLYVDPALEPIPDKPSELPPLLDRPVGWAEVKTRVFGRVCVPCHAADDERDPGPGNAGGFGYRGEDLAMRTYATLVRGGLHESGERFSVLEPEDEGETLPLVVDVMWRRRIDALRDHVPPFHDHERPPRDESGEPGMPMGLPPLGDEEVSLVRTWIAQGCPGPTVVAPSSDDGPIARNRGCEQRDATATGASDARMR